MGILLDTNLVTAAFSYYIQRPTLYFLKDFTYILANHTQKSQLDTPEEKHAGGEQGITRYFKTPERGAGIR